MTVPSADIGNIIGRRSGVSPPLRARNSFVVYLQRDGRVHLMGRRIFHITWC